MSLTEKSREIGLPIEQIRVLILLAETPGQPTRKLAEKALIDGPTFTKLIDRMVANSLVYRLPDSQDKRMIRIMLSTRGLALRERIKEFVRTQENELDRVLSKAEIRQLKRILLKVIETYPLRAPHGILA